MNRNQLKYIAVIAMMIDHIGMFLLSPGPGDASALQVALYALLRTTGRLTAPLMLFFLTEGYVRTSSKIKYGIRLLVFGIASQIPYALSHYNNLLVADLFKIRFMLGTAFPDCIQKGGFISADFNLVVFVHPAHVSPFIFAKEESAQSFEVVRILCEHEIISILCRTILVSEYRFGSYILNTVFAEILIVKRNTAERADIHLLIKIDVEKSAACWT